MPGSRAKKPALIGSTSVPVTDSKEDLEETSVVRDLERAKCITWNVKLNEGNQKVSALLDSGNEANLISRAYAAQLLLKIGDTSWSLATIKKQQISPQGMVIALFEISDSADHTSWFKETFPICRYTATRGIRYAFPKVRESRCQLDGMHYALEAVGCRNGTYDN